MPERLVACRELPVAVEDDVALVRRAVKDTALARGLDTFAVAAITTASSELARNALLHGGGGGVRIEEIEDGERGGVRVHFEDRGPGIGDLDRALAGGHSTRGSLGLGLSGSRRLADQFDLHTSGQGTRVTITKWVRLHAPRR